MSLLWHVDWFLLHEVGSFSSKSHRIARFGVFGLLLVALGLVVVCRLVLLFIQSVKLLLSACVLSVGIGSVWVVTLICSLRRTFALSRHN
jgi:hypothetical protein